ncbi:electron transporter, putative (Protein of unknown function, DUF547) [Thalictrum thalictroides]|uniref:Electron transporter n=1 Tax=Thalictrum thalictroides TaxID=46969 RepID=A0A7J6W8V3_THATH|nr:electron transporter, putative (Protein of unknown function, DUF547) [Thalictrum thalictroides]
MGVEHRLATKEKPHDYCLKPPKSMGVSSGHKRSKSEPDMLEDNLDISPKTRDHLKLELKGSNEMMKRSPNMEKSFLKKQEIAQLEKILQDHSVVRRGFEEVLGKRASAQCHDTLNENLMPEPAKGLIKEIAVLEWEVLHLERYLLSLYRKAFNQKISSVSQPTKDGKLIPPASTEKGTLSEVNDKTKKRHNLAVHSSRLHRPQDLVANPRKEIGTTMVNEMLLDSGIHRSHSSLSYRSAFRIRTSPPMENQAKGVWSCHSQPLSSLEYVPSATSCMTSLGEHLGTSVADDASEAPNRISEDMIKCMSAMYCKVSEPPVINHGLSSSPTSSLSSESLFSPQDQYDRWSPCHRKDSSFEARLNNPFHIDGLKEFSGPYSTMAEVPAICRDSQRLKDIDDILQKYRSLVRQLEKVTLKRLKHEEKLAFWINIHNALVMHALLVYGIPQNNVKRISLILKAAYNVGGHTISADTIQSSILGCRMPRPVQWLRTLFSGRTKFKAGDDQQSYIIEHSEPLLHFALCSGSHSDPALRVYTPKKVFQELETAKEEYIRATLGVRKEQKILLPKIVESFAKDSGLCPASLAEMIEQSVPETLRKTLRSVQRKSRKSIEWVPHNFAFRYLISNELVK